MEPGAIIDLISFVGPPICRYWKYHRKLNEFLTTLKSMKEDLSSRKEDIELRLSLECRTQKVPRKEVENWIRKAKITIDEIGSVEDKVSKSKGNYVLRGYLGKLVIEKTQQVKEVYDQGNFSDSLVTDAPEGIGMTLPTSELVGETTVKVKIWEHLTGDNVFKIGVCGMGGIGKTTIMKHIHNQLLKEANKFDKVIWITVSQEFDVAKLQKDIASELGEDMSKYDDKIKRAAVLSNMLKKRKYVLILDDVWKIISLDEVGIPEPTITNGCKLVLTTRSIQVARSMGCEVIKVEVLSEMESLNLFLSKVGVELSQVPTLESTLKQVVKQCDGLPLAIVTVASSMKGEHDIQVWQNALNELQTRIASVEGIADEVLGRLKFSYDRLMDPKIKRCFLYCALYPEDYQIDKEELIEYWIVEGFIDEMESRQAMNYKGHDILKKLENNCLLESAKDGQSVKMHDLVREMALQITSSSPRYLVKAGMNLTELPSEQEWAKDLEKVSLMENYISEIPSNMTLSICTALSTLILKGNFRLKKIHESFFRPIMGLKILDLSKTRIIFLPNSISDLHNLNALLLQYCRALMHVPSLAKLGALKKLHLGNTSIRDIPKGIEMLSQLRYLDLHANIKKMPEGILPKLSLLQHLRLGRAFAKVEEVARLSKLESIELRFYNIQDYHMFLSLQQRCCNKYNLLVSPEQFQEFGRYNKRCVKFSRLGVCGDSIMLPTGVQVLIIQYFNDLTSLSDISSLKDTSDFKYKEIENVLYFSSCSSILQSIEELHLNNLHNLSVLLGEERSRDRANSRLPTAIAPCIFSCLRIVEISTCPKLERLFSPELLQNLQNLEEITLFELELVEIVAAQIDEEEEEDDKEAKKNSIILPLPKLRSIKLYRLPKLKRLCNSRYVMICNSLKAIDIVYCPNLKTILPLLPQPYNGQTLSHPSLEIINFYPKECWDSLEWNHPNIKNLLHPILHHSLLRYNVFISLSAWAEEPPQIY